MSDVIETNKRAESESSNNALEKKNKSVLNTCRFFSAGSVVCLILLFISGASSVLFVYAYLLPITLGFFVALVASPWLQNLKPVLFKIIAWTMFIVGALIGLMIIASVGFLAQ